MPPKNFFLKFDPYLPIILAIAAFLLFFRLDHRPFWQDEGETACLAKNVLTYGKPLAFDGVNVISQEEGREYRSDFLWRWSPWLQIYVAAGAFRLGGLTTTMGRLPFALMALVSVLLVYFLILRLFGDPAWARLASFILATMVPFLLYARQCRYYSLGALLVLIFLLGFRGRWQSRPLPALLLVCSSVLLFHTNYLLFFSFGLSCAIAALLVYRDELPPLRIMWLGLLTALLVIPGILLYNVRQQTGMMDLTLYPDQLARYLAELCEFVVPLPVGLALLWRWRRIFSRRPFCPESPAEKFVICLGTIIIVSILVLSLVPQYSFRYLVHLIPLCAIILAWAILKVWRYHRFSAVLLAVLLIATNWLHIVPMDLLGLTNRPPDNDFNMLTHSNIPLKLFLAEITSDYPDVNGSFIRFFQAHARHGDTVITTYGDLPLQFYTNCRVLGGLQARTPEPGELPDWVVRRNRSRTYRDRLLLISEDYIRSHLRLSEDYQALTLPYPDELYGNIPDPSSHRFVPPRDPFVRIIIYRKKGASGHDQAS